KVHAGFAATGQLAVAGVVGETGAAFIALLALIARRKEAEQHRPSEVDSICTQLHEGDHSTGMRTRGEPSSRGTSVSHLLARGCVADFRADAEVSGGAARTYSRSRSPRARTPGP